jgi:[ribosomal protein S5]-alanine N-acetyltransferase
MIITQTPRLLLTHFTETDAPFILRILNTPGWLQFIGDRNVRTLEVAQEYTKDKLISGYTKFGFGMYAVKLKDTGEVIGMCGLVKRDHLEHVDIGYAFLPEFTGQGYAKEAAAAILEYANDTLGLRPVLAIVTPDNSSSIKLLAKLNFAFERSVAVNGEELFLFKQIDPHCVRVRKQAEPAHPQPRHNPEP